MVFIIALFLCYNEGMKKEVGIILIIAGIALIFLSLFWSYRIFVQTKNPPSVFSIQRVREGNNKTNLEIGFDGISLNGDLLGKGINKVLPLDILAKILNLFSWTFFAFILIYGGGKVSQIGIRLLT